MYLCDVFGMTKNKRPRLAQSFYVVGRVLGHQQKTLVLGSCRISTKKESTLDFHIWIQLSDACPFMDTIFVVRHRLPQHTQPLQKTYRVRPSGLEHTPTCCFSAAALYVRLHHGTTSILVRSRRLPFVMMVGSELYRWQSWAHQLYAQCVYEIL